MKKIFLTVVVLFATLCAFAQTEIPSITTAQYEQLPKNNQVFVLIFTMEKFCPPCTAAKKLLFPRLTERYGQTENVHLYLVNVSQNEERGPNSLYGRYGVQGAPHFLVLVNDSVQFSQNGFDRNKPDELFQKIVAAVEPFK